MKKGVIIGIIVVVIIILGISILFLGMRKSTENKESQKVEIPASIENNCIGFLIGNPDEETRTAAEIGAAWGRPHPGPFAWGTVEPKKEKFVFKETDFWVKKIQENNIAILGTIWPYADWDQEICHGEECKVSSDDEFYTEEKFLSKSPPGIPSSRCIPCNFDDYKNFVSKIVERYDGDGINDMPDLKIPIKYWEVLNEPEMAEPTLTFFKGTPEEYTKILKQSYEIIKTTCSDCKVVQGGAQHSMPDNLAWWEQALDSNAGNYFDIANIHYISEGDLNTLNVKDFKELLQSKGINKQIWVTEAQFNSKEQVENSVQGALNAGASKVFFTQFEIGRFGIPNPGEYSDVYEGIALKCG